jgi:4-amino-4-deoxy-L-arabinose transferase-like glycosyltransferase
MKGFRQHWENSTYGWLILASVTTMLVVVSHLIWLDLHTALETWDDDAGLFRLALCFYGDGSGESCSAGAPYPPLVPALTALHFGLVGETDLHAALVSLWPFLGLLCLSLFMGMRQLGGSMAGLAATALGPVVVWSLHIRGKYYTEVPLAALVVASVVSYSASDGFRKRWPSALFGVLLGLGLLTKWSFAFFLGPVAVLAISLTLRDAVVHPIVRWLVAVVAVAVPVCVAAGAAGRIAFGLTIGFWSAVGLCMVLAWMSRYRSAWLAPEGRSRMLNVGICSVLCVLIAAPWYWTYLPNMQEFLAANLAQKFHGDPVSGLYGWPFYPAVLVTRMMSTPLLTLFLLGAVLACVRKSPPLVRWSLLALVCGALVLGVLPYRSGRYLIAGLGLVVPVALWPLVRWPVVARFALPAVVAVGLGHQVSWIPIAVGGARVPHHWSILTLPEQDLMGNTKNGIYQAYADLIRPRWRFLPLANPPIHRTPLSKRVSQFVRENAGVVPSLTVVVDPMSTLNLNAMRTHQKAAIPLPTTRIIEAGSRLNVSSLTAWKQRAAKPRDQPATASGPGAPRQLYVVIAHSPLHGPSRAEFRMLQNNGFVPVRRDGVLGGFEPAGITIWKAR